MEATKRFGTRKQKLDPEQAAELKRKLDNLSAEDLDLVKSGLRYSKTVYFANLLPKLALVFVALGLVLFTIFQPISNSSTSTGSSNILVFYIGLALMGIGILGNILRVILLSPIIMATAKKLFIRAAYNNIDDFCKPEAQASRFVERFASALLVSRIYTSIAAVVIGFLIYFFLPHFVGRPVDLIALFSIILIPIFLGDAVFNIISKNLKRENSELYMKCKQTLVQLRIPK